MEYGTDLADPRGFTGLRIDMPLDAFSVGLSGMRAAESRLQNSAHNVGNLLTEGFRPSRTELVARRGGGVDAHVRTSERAEPVNLAREFALQRLAAVQFEASARSVSFDLAQKGALLDLLA